MAATSPLAYFRRTLLVTLAALPACGGSTVPGGPGGDDAGNPDHPDADHADAIGLDVGLPGTSCDWTSLPPPPCGGCSPGCQWELSYVGDPVTCAGFASVGTPAQCAALCGTDSHGESPTECSINAATNVGTLYCAVVGTTYCPATMNGGRRPAYFASLGFGPVPRGRELGVHFARAACMEAGSVDAFRMLRDELVAHGAPKRLVRAASRAIRDEIRHVRQTSALARRFGEEPVAPRPAPPRSRRRFAEVALENAVEGCVRETYSALECAWQAEVAADPVVRATMKRIARDEMRHLELSWAVHAWAVGRLDAASRARVAEAQRSEIATMLDELARNPHDTLLATGGLPRAAQSQALVSAIARRLAA
ncbi:MAG TPA: ferritin-like domain-containing protein [Polyangiaceae bacterium]